MANTQPTVSVVIVTYNSAHYLASCLASLRRQDVQLEFIIVDNASREQERPRCRDVDVKEVILNTRNKGFAPAVNQGLSRIRAPYALVINPDAYLAAGALAQLLSFLQEHPDVAAVSPRLWWDAEHTALLPFVEVPTLSLLLARLVAGRWRNARALFDCWQITKARQGWFATEAFPVSAILGGCVLIPARVLTRVGQLDPQFPFYYEEVEWSLRARRHGYHLFIVPSAEAVHTFGHSRKGSRRVERWAAVSARRYWRMRYGKLGARLAAGLLAQTAQPQLTAIEDLGECAEPPTFTWEEPSQPQVLEIAFDPLFGHTAAIFPQKGEFRFPDALWKEMPLENYHARLLRGPALRPTRYWRWRRSAAIQDV